jgi:hypothetical protein
MVCGIELGNVKCGCYDGGDKPAGEISSLNKQSFDDDDDDACKQFGTKPRYEDRARQDSESRPCSEL